MRFRLSLLFVVLGVCGYYFWAATRFTEISPNGYYNYLAEGWAQGHLFTPLTPDPKLLAQANPWDPNHPDEIKIHDMVLFNGHYYLYHGPAPLVLLLPYRWVTGKQLPEVYAAAGLASLAFLAMAAVLFRLNREASPVLYAVLGLANAIPFLLHRIWVYEVAILAGCATVMLALALRYYNHHRAAGLVLGLVTLSRPHLLLVSLCLERRSWPWVIPGCALAALHNYLRFGDPLDFGLKHLIAGPNQQVPAFSVQFLLPSLYLFLCEVPRFVARFPFIELHNQPPIPLPPLFFHENMIGALWLAPFVALQKLEWRMAAAAAAILVFLSSTGWVTERYLVDFLPLLVLASLVAAKKIAAWQWLLLAFAVAMNLLLHLQGPYNQFL